MAPLGAVSHRFNFLIFFNNNDDDNDNNDDDDNDDNDNDDNNNDNNSDDNNLCRCMLTTSNKLITPSRVFKTVHKFRKRN